MFLRRSCAVTAYLTLLVQHQSELPDQRTVVFAFVVLVFSFGDQPDKLLDLVLLVPPSIIATPGTTETGTSSSPSIIATPGTSETG